MKEKQQYIPLNIPREQAELIMLDRIHPDSPEGRAILSRSAASLEQYGGLPPEYYQNEREISGFKRREFILNPVSVESAQTWFVTAFYIAGALGLIAGGVYLLALAVEFLAVYADVLIGVVAVLLGVALIVVLSKVQTTKRVIHENRGPGVTINKNYIQNNY